MKRYRVVISFDVMARDDEHAINKSNDWVGMIDRKFDNRPELSEVILNEFGSLPSEQKSIYRKVQSSRNETSGK